ncbi:hypothetical protein C8R44DRAFT_884165 [Mycena epipterygia]|nr:hypothetical protein C8R44DRAFT_884165 [Mycena epipterygia]
MPPRSSKRKAASLGPLCDLHCSQFHFQNVDADTTRLAKQSRTTPSSAETKDEEEVAGDLHVLQDNEDGKDEVTLASVAALPFRELERIRKREKRAEPDYQATKLAKKEAKALDFQNDVIQVWLNRLLEAIELDQATSAQLQQEPLAALQRSDTLSAQAAHVEHTSHSGIWDALKPATVKFLFAAARGLEVADVEAAVAAGVLEESLPGDERPFSGSLFYSRIWFPRKRANNSVAACLYRYLTAYPADAAWTIKHLIDVGEQATDVQTVLYGALEPVGHGSTVNLLFDALNSKQQWATYTSSISAKSCKLFPYSGESGESRPWQRHADDMDAVRRGELPTRLGNFLRVNDDHIEWKLFQVSDLSLPDSLGIRLDVTASDTETFLIRTHRGQCMNSAVGGFIRRFVPNALVAALKPLLLPTTSPGIYGSYPLPRLSARILSLIKDEYKHVTECLNQPLMTNEAMLSVLRNGAEVIRGLSSDGLVPLLRIMKDIPMEDFQGVDHAPFQANTGKALQSYRRIHHLLHPTIPLTGDLTATQIACWIGPFINFWRVVIRHWWWWLHCLWLSRLLRIMRPVIIETWSNAVFTMLTIGALESVWERVPDEVRGDFMAGSTPPNIKSFLPETSTPGWYPRTTDQSYLDSVGQLLVVQTGFHLADLCITIPNLDPGVIKYDPAEAYLVEHIVYTVTIITQVAVKEVEIFRMAGKTPSYTDAALAWSYFEDLRSAIEYKLSNTDLRATLNDLKAELGRASSVSGHLRSLLGHRDASNREDEDAAPYSIPGITETTAKGAPRIAQYERIIALARMLQRGGANPDPYHLVPLQFRDDMFGSGFKGWFLALPPGIRISNSSKVWGNSPAAFKNQLANHDRFGHDTQAQSRGGIAGTATLRAKKAMREEGSMKAKALVQSLRDPFKLLPKQKATGNMSTRDGWRYGKCQSCGELAIGRDHNCFHLCISGDKIKMNEEAFSTLRRIVYAQDAFLSSELAPLVGDAEPLDFVRISALSVINRPGNRALVETILPGFDFRYIAGDIFVPLEFADVHKDPHGLQLTLAIDSALHHASLSRFTEDDASQRGEAWGYIGLPSTWVDGKRSMMKCAFGTLKIMKTRTTFYEHACTNSRPLVEAEKARCAQAHEKYVQDRTATGPSNCHTQQTEALQTALQLPVEHLRRFWWQARVFPHLTS